MKMMWALAGLSVLAVGWDRAETPQPAAAAGTALSTVHLTTTLSEDDNLELRDGVMTLLEAGAADAPPVLLVMAEMGSPAFNFHVQSDCAAATPYIEDLIRRSATTAALTISKPDIACLEVSPAAAGNASGS